jgi:hypothetical protein
MWDRQVAAFKLSVKNISHILGPTTINQLIPCIFCITSMSMVPLTPPRTFSNTVRKMLLGELPQTRIPNEGTTCGETKHASGQHMHYLTGPPEWTVQLNMPVHT